MYPLSTIWVGFFGFFFFATLETNTTDFPNDSLGLKMTALGSVRGIEHFMWTTENYPECRHQGREDHAEGYLSPI